ncbi:MAG: amino-acid N-acetyltransferase [Verrucomicrobiota bacterium]
MSQLDTGESKIKPTDLRGILKYVPMFREQVFVIALDGSVVAHEMFPNVLLDIAVLRSLNIKIVLVHGVGQQLRALAEKRSIQITDPHGEGVTDSITLELATEATSSVNLQIVQGLTKNKLRCAASNAVRSKEIGILKGEDQLLSGNVDKLDIKLINKLLESDTIPVVAPIAFNREGNSLRINSDLLAAELASMLEASKLIFLTTQDGLKINGESITNLPVAELEALLEKPEGDAIPERLRSKSEHAIKAIHASTPRAHILDGRIFGALLNEVFDKVGIGTMVYSNQYQSIRQAILADAYSIFNITRNAVRSEALKERSQEYIESEINNFLVYEIDGSLIGCTHLRTYENGKIIEIGSVYVQPFYQKRGVGRQMIECACKEAEKRGASRIFALTTQASKFFTTVCGFTEGSLSDLPEERRIETEQNGRNSKVLYLDL